MSVEEIHPGIWHGDDLITHVLSEFDRFDPASRPLLELEEYVQDGTPIYRSERFTEIVQQVVQGLRESGLVPGLNISVLANEPDEPDEPYAMVEVFDDVRGIYLSRGIEIRRLIDDSEAVGWAGVLAIARELIRFADDLH